MKRAVYSKQNLLKKIFTLKKNWHNNKQLKLHTKHFIQSIAMVVMVKFYLAHLLIFILYQLALDHHPFPITVDTHPKI